MLWPCPQFLPPMKSFALLIFPTSKFSGTFIPNKDYDESDNLSKLSNTEEVTPL